MGEAIKIATQSVAQAITHLFLEQLHLLGGHCVRFGNYRNDVHFVAQPLHKLHIEGLQAVAGGRDKVQAAVHAAVRDGLSLYSRLSRQIFLVLVLDEIDDGHPAGKGLRVEGKFNICFILWFNIPI